MRGESLGRLARLPDAVHETWLVELVSNVRGVKAHSFASNRASVAVCEVVVTEGLVANGAMRVAWPVGPRFSTLGVEDHVLWLLGKEDRHDAFQGVRRGLWSGSGSCTAWLASGVRDCRSGTTRLGARQGLPVLLNEAEEHENQSLCRLRLSEGDGIIVRINDRVFV